MPDRWYVGLFERSGFVMPEPDHPENVKPDERIWRMAPSPERAAMRARTPAGFAEAVCRANSEGSA